MATSGMMVLGHRGAPREAPENTLEGFSIAMGHGAHGVELDVRLSGDDVVVVCHDPELTRLAGLAARVRAMTLEELRAVDLGANTRIPTLDAALDLWRAKGLVNVEIKTDDVDPAALALAVAGVLSRHPRTEVIVSSFSTTMLARLRTLSPMVPRGALLRPGSTPAARRNITKSLKYLGVMAAHPYWADATEERVAMWRASCLGVNAWTVDDVAVARRLRAIGVSAVITNLPAEILKGLVPLV